VQQGKSGLDREVGAPPGGFWFVVSIRTEDETLELIEDEELELSALEIDELLLLLAEEDEEDEEEEL
jgi:hypothetical protein